MKSRLLLTKQDRHLCNNIPETAVAYLEYNLGADPEKRQTKFSNTDDIQEFSSRKTKANSIITKKKKTEHIRPKKKNDGRATSKPMRMRIASVQQRSTVDGVLDRTRGATAYVGILHFTLLHTETPTWRLQISPHILRSNSAVPRRCDRFSVHVNPRHVT